MSHHFDTPTAREDPRINVNDFYLFDGPPGKTVMALTVNPDAGLSAPDFFRDEALYAFRFDLNNDAREEITFKFRFDNVRHASDADHSHIQSFSVRKATGPDALRGLDGDLLLQAQTNTPTPPADIRAFAGLAPELFAGDAFALRNFLEPLHKDSRFYPDAFLHKKDFFAQRNVSAIVLELPTSLIGHGPIRAWATASLVGHAPEVQVSRWGLPLLTHIFLSDPAQPNLKEDYNRATPSEDLSRFAPSIAAFVEKLTTAANSTPNPAAYANRIANLFSPSTLPYLLGSVASFDYAGFNGRPLADDAMDIMLTLAANSPLSDGVTPDKSRIQKTFPYYAQPFTKSDQSNITPAAQSPAKPH